MLFEGNLIKIKKKRLRVIPSSKSCILGLFVLLKYLTSLNNKVYVSFLLTNYRGGAEITTQISTYEISNISFNSFCLSCVSGGEVVNKSISDSMYKEVENLKGWEFVFEKEIALNEADIQVMLGLKETFIKELKQTHSI